MRIQSLPSFLGCRSKAPPECIVIPSRRKLGECRTEEMHHRRTELGLRSHYPNSEGQALPLMNTAITLDRPDNYCHGYYLWQELIPVDYELFR